MAKAARRVAVLGIAVLLISLQTTTARAEVDDTYHWDFRSISIGTSGLLPIRGQFGGDAALDILWYAPGATADTIWYGRVGQRGAATFRRARMTINGRYVPVVGDFAGDEGTDILWYGPGTVPDYLWTSTLGGSAFSSRQVSVGGAFSPTVLVDFHDGQKDDVVWYDASAAADYLWHFADDGSGSHTSTKLVMNRPMGIAAGDFDGNRSSDLFLYGPGAANDVIWHFDDDGTYRVDGIVLYEKDFVPTTVFQDVEDDLLMWASGPHNERYFQGQPGGGLWEWTTTSMAWTGAPYPMAYGAMIVVPDGPEILFSAEAQDDPEWRPSWYQLAPASHDVAAGTVPVKGDFDGDGYLDIVWYGSGSAPDQLWYTAPTSATSATSVTAPTSAKQAPPGPRPLRASDRDVGVPTPAGTSIGA